MKHREIVDVWATKFPSMNAGNIAHDSGDPEKADPLLDKQWLDVGVFEYPYAAPRARNKDLNTLVEAITDKTRNG